MKLDYESGFKRPFQDLEKLVIGILLQLIPVVNLLAAGYGLECARTSLNGKWRLPEWKDWADLFIKGLLAVVIALVYAIPAIILFLLGPGALILGIFGSMLAGNDPTTAFGGFAFGAGGMVLFLIGGFILALIAYFIYPAALMEYVRKENFTAAFNVPEVLRNVFTADYIVLWFITTVYAIILASVLTIIPYIGTAAGLFIAEVTEMSLFGQLYRQRYEDTNP